MAFFGISAFAVLAAAAAMYSFLEVGESVEIGLQLCHITLNQFKDCGIVAAALQVREQCIKLFDFRRDLAEQLFPLSRGADREQRRGHGDDSFSLARDLKGRKD